MTNFRTRKSLIAVVKFIGLVVSGLNKFEDWEKTNCCGKGGQWSCLICGLGGLEKLTSVSKLIGLWSILIDWEIISGGQWSSISN